jgi:hypothetical protein
VRDTAGTVRASLQALGLVLEDHVVLASDGSVLDVPPPSDDPPAVHPLPPALVNGLVAVVVASSAPALATSIRDVAGELVFEWGPVTADLVEINPPRVRLSPKLRRALQTVLAGTDSRRQRVGLAFAALDEAATLIGDALRHDAQAVLAGAPAAEQAAALEAHSVAINGDAAAISEAVEALLANAQLA